MSIESRRTAAVYDAIKELFEQGKTSVRPGDVNSVMRARGAPVGTWQMRAEFARLEQENLLQWDSATNVWTLAEQPAVSDAACNS